MNVQNHTWDEQMLHVKHYTSSAHCS